MLKRTLAFFLVFLLPAMQLVSGHLLFLQAQELERESETGSDTAQAAVNPDGEAKRESLEETENQTVELEQSNSEAEGSTQSVEVSDSYLTSNTTLDEQGNPALITIEIKQALPDNNRQNPYRIDLGTNPATAKEITLSGNGRLSASDSASIRLTFSPEITSAYLALPVESASMSDGTVAMIENSQSGEYSPVADCYLLKAAEQNEPSFIVVPFEKLEERNITMQVVNNAKEFLDGALLPKWGQGPVSYVSARNIMMGTGNGETFSGQESVTRAQFATTIYRFSNQNTPETWPESVPHGYWWSIAAGYVVDKKIMGVGSSFDPDTLITREQAATIFYRASGDHLDNPSLLDTYRDKSKVSLWAIDGMAWAAEHGILGQGSDLDPESSLNRLQLAALIERYLQQGFN